MVCNHFPPPLSPLRGIFCFTRCLTMSSERTNKGQVYFMNGRLEVEVDDREEMYEYSKRL